MNTTMWLWSKWSNFFWGVLDIIVTEHTNRGKWSEILLFFDTPFNQQSIKSCPNAYPFWKVDVDSDGDFDILVDVDGEYEYEEEVEYKNTKYKNTRRPKENL